MKVFDKSKVYNDNFPKSLNIGRKENYWQKTIAEKFNGYFINVGSKRPANLPSSNTNFESYLSNKTTFFLDKPLNEKEFKDSFFALITNKSLGYGKLHVNVMGKLYHELQVPLMSIISLSLKTGIFPEKWKLLRFLQYLRKAISRFFQTRDQYLFFHVFQKIWNVQCTTD